MSEDTPPDFPPLTVTVCLCIQAVAGYQLMDPLQAQRALAAIRISHPEVLTPAATALFTAMWVDFKRVSDANVVAAVLASAVGEKISKEAMQAAQTKEIKDALTKNTQEAFAAGAFGLPWFEGECFYPVFPVHISFHVIVTNSKGEVEAFWGFDHLGQVAAFLELEKPTHGGWRAMI
jgi:DSBA-like thioredoxin domain